MELEANGKRRTSPTDTSSSVFVVRPVSPHRPPLGSHEPSLQATTEEEEEEEEEDDDDDEEEEEEEKEDPSLVPVFRPFTDDSLRRIAKRAREAEEERQRKRDSAARGEPSEAGAGGAPSAGAPSGAADKKDKEEEKQEPNPVFEVGKQLPPKVGDFPATLFGKPIEDLDEFYDDKYTFMVIARDKTIFRFSATKAFFIFSPLNPIRRSAIFILTHPLFSLFVMIVILVNCFFMASNSEIAEAEKAFTVIYTMEGLVKMFARGFILANFTYLRDAWNWLDFCVVVLAYLTMGADTLGVPLGNVAVLRTFRVLRALKTVAVVPGLKTIVGALMEAVRRLRDVMILSLFVLSIFALIGLQLYQGSLKRKCVRLPEANETNETAIGIRAAQESNWYRLDPLKQPLLCGQIGGGQCPENYTCMIIGPNPDYGYTNFDNFGWAMLCAFRLMTQDAWENLYQQVLRANGPYHVFFFIIVIFLGSFYLVNVILAIVAMSYDDCRRQDQEELKAMQAEAQLAEYDGMEDAFPDYEPVDGGGGQRGGVGSLRALSNTSFEVFGGRRRRSCKQDEISMKSDVGFGVRRKLSLLQRQEAKGGSLSLPGSPFTKRPSQRHCVSTKPHLPGSSRRTSEQVASHRPMATPCLDNLDLPFADDSEAVTPTSDDLDDLCKFTLKRPRLHSISRRLSELNNRFVSGANSATASSRSLTASRCALLSHATPTGSVVPCGAGGGSFFCPTPPPPQPQPLPANHRVDAPPTTLPLRCYNDLPNNNNGGGGGGDNVWSGGRPPPEPTHFHWNTASIRRNHHHHRHHHSRNQFRPTTNALDADGRTLFTSESSCANEATAASSTGAYGDEGKNGKFLHDNPFLCRTPSTDTVDLQDVLVVKDLFKHAAGRKRGYFGYEKGMNKRDFLREKCMQLLFGWECCPAWYKFARVVELFIMDAFVDLFITVCIIINTVFMAMEHDNMNATLVNILKYGNYVFTGIFTVEASLKILALGLYKYLQDNWSCFDFVIVLLSLIELGLENVRGLSILRSFRLLRVFKLAKSWPTLNLLIGIIGRTMGALGNLCLVLAIIIFIFAVMGMQLFGSRYNAKMRWHFVDFLHSFMIVFRILCGEWIDNMWMCISLHGNICIPFFLLTMIIGNLVVLNLFLALLLSSFGAETLRHSQDEEGPNKLQEAIDRINRFAIYVKSHVVYCVKVKLWRKATPTDFYYNEPDDRFHQAAQPETVLDRMDGSVVGVVPVTVTCPPAVGNGRIRQRESSIPEEGEESPEHRNNIGNKAIRMIKGTNKSPHVGYSPVYSYEPDDEVIMRSNDEWQNTWTTTRSLVSDLSTLKISKTSSQNNDHNNSHTPSSSSSSPSSSSSTSSSSSSSSSSTSPRSKNSSDSKAEGEEEGEEEEEDTSLGGSRPHSLLLLSTGSDCSFSRDDTASAAGNEKALDAPEINEVNVVFVKYPDDCCPQRCVAGCGGGGGDGGDGGVSWWETLERTLLGQLWWKFRCYAYALVDHTYFETFIIVMILASSLALAVEDRETEGKPTLKQALKILDKAFTVIFVFEMAVKMGAYGFKKYFTDAWCWLDFIIVAISLVGWFAEDSNAGNMGAFRALRTLRALRPLRAVSRWEGMKVVVNALIQAIPAIFNVLLVCLVFWLIFSIMGVNLFSGRFGKCLENGLPVQNRNMTRRDCNTTVDRNLTWSLPKINFDNVLIGYLALFQVATFKGWMDIMYAAIDSQDVGQQPIFENRVLMYLYFVLFIIFGSFFTLNLFIGVIIENFNMQKKKAGGSLEMLMTEDQKKYYNAMKKLGSKQPTKPIPKPKLLCQLFFFKVTKDQKFDIVIMIFILLNMMTMAMEHYGEPPEYEAILGHINSIFIVIFTLEFVMKLLALRQFYFKEPWNVFDFVVVVGSILTWGLHDHMDNLPISPTLLRVIRVFRVGRVLRLVKSAKGIRTLLFSLAVSMPALFNIGLLLFLVMFIYAIVGVSSFMYVKHTAGIDDMFNFQTFFNAMIILFQTCTSAGWNDVLAGLMNDQPPDCTLTPENLNRPGGDCGNSALGIMYLVSYLVISFLVIINMYIAVILENFSQATEDVQQGLTQDDFDMYYEVWERFDEKASQYIPLDQLGEFVDTLEPPLRLPAPNYCKLVLMNIPICDGERVHCVDILDALTKNFLGTAPDAGEIGDLKKGPDRIDYHPATTTLKRQRQVVMARLIQRTWRNYRLLLDRQQQQQQHPGVVVVSTGDQSPIAPDAPGAAAGAKTDSSKNDKDPEFVQTVATTTENKNGCPRTSSKREISDVDEITTLYEDTKS